MKFHCHTVGTQKPWQLHTVQMPNPPTMLLAIYAASKVSAQQLTTKEKKKVAQRSQRCDSCTPRFLCSSEPSKTGCRLSPQSRGRMRWRGCTRASFANSMPSLQAPAGLGDVRQVRESLPQRAVVHQGPHPEHAHRGGVRVLQVAPASRTPPAPACTRLCRSVGAHAEPWSRVFGTRRLKQPYSFGVTKPKGTLGQWASSVHPMW